MKGYRTIVVNAVPLVAALLDYLVNNGQLISAVVDSPKTAASLMLGFNLVNLCLRFVTNTPVGKSQ